MKDCSKEIRSFHNDRVKLSEDTRKELKGRAEANEGRIIRGLEKNDEPAPLYFILQGSYAMRTTVQHPNDDYDIDYGVVFLQENLKGAQGAHKTSLAARQMVCDALLADDRTNFSKDPEVLPNCVRVYYKAGYHVDVPVYRKADEDADNSVDEIASVAWKKSDPEGVTAWFQEQLDAKRSKEEVGKSHQMRRMVRLMKKFAISRSSWNMPSGFVLTRLVDELYWSYQERDDKAFYDVMNAMKNRLEFNLVVSHPVLSENIAEWDSPKTKELKERLGDALNDLSVLFESNCTKKAALKAWKKVFNDDYFDDLLEEETTAKSFSIITETPRDPVDKQGGGKFG